MEDYIPGLTLHDRAVSGLPLSIGTSLAFESLFEAQQAPYDPNRTIPNTVNVFEYGECWINVTTLHRNIVAAIDRTVAASTPADLYAGTLAEEIGVLKNLFTIEGGGRCKPHFYYSTYEKLKCTNALGFELRSPHTESQKFYNSMMLNSIKLAQRHTEEIEVLDDRISPKKRGNALIFTHQPYDITAQRHFERLDLLESNTGILKPKSLLYTKYYPVPGESMSHLPFMMKLLAVFGDKHLIKPTVMSIRKEILEIGRRRHWNPMTTKDKVKMDLGFDICDSLTMAYLNAFE